MGMITEGWEIVLASEKENEKERPREEYGKDMGIEKEQALGVKKKTNIGK